MPWQSLRPLYNRTVLYKAGATFVPAILTSVFSMGRLTASVSVMLSCILLADNYSDASD